jgi:hypothetical protein
MLKIGKYIEAICFAVSRKLYTAPDTDAPLGVSTKSQPLLPTTKVWITFLDALFKRVHLLSNKEFSTHERYFMAEVTALPSAKLFHTFRGSSQRPKTSRIGFSTSRRLQNLLLSVSKERLV